MSPLRILLAWALVLGAPAATLAQTDEPATGDTATAETEEPAAPTPMREAPAERQEPATTMRPATTMAVDDETAARREAARERFLERQRAREEARQEAARAREARVTETEPPVEEPVQPGPAERDEPDEITEELQPGTEGAVGDQPPGQRMEQDLHDQPVDQVYHEVHGDAQQAEEGELLDHANTGAASEDVADHEGAHGHGADVGLDDVFSSIEFWGSVVNFTLLVLIIVLLARKPMRGFLAARRQSIEEGLAEAKRLREAAQEKYDEYSERLEKLDREIAAIRKDMVAAGEAERDRIVADAEAKAARMRREAEFLIEQQMKQLRVDLTREAVEAAVNAAEDVLKAKTSTQDQQRLAQQYLERLAADAKQEAAQ